MKKLIALLLALLVLAYPALAEEEDWYLETAKELTETLGVLVQDESYVAMYGRTDYACMEPLKTADFAAVKAVYRCTLPDEAGVRVLVNLSAGGMSDAALERITAGLPNMILTAYHGKLGVEVVAASATMTFSKTYVAPEGFVPCIYLLELDGAMAAVSFSRTGDETLTATAGPLFSVEGATVEETLERFNSDNFPMEIEQIQ